MTESNMKQKVNKLQAQIGELARMVQQYAQVVLLHEEDLKDMRETRNEMIAKGLIDGPNKEDEVSDPTKNEEPKEAKVEDYFGESESSEDTL